MSRSFLSCIGALCVLTLGGCPTTTESPDGGPVTSDAAPEDTGGSGDDAAMARDAGEAAPIAVTVTGQVQHEHRSIDESGLGPVTSVPTVGVSVELVSEAGDAISARETTDDEGRFSLSAMVVEGTPIAVRVIAARDDESYRLSVQDMAEAVYSVTTGTFPATATLVRDVEILEEDNSGAFAIFDTFVRGLDFVRAVLPTAPPALPVFWERGRTTPGGTSYFSQDPQALFILGGPDDADEYDDPVLFHEFGHFVEFVYSRTSSPGGDHDGSRTDPTLAWGEGFGTWFGAVANGSSLYLDSLVSGEITLARDLATLPLEEDYTATPGDGLEQNVGEYLVGGALYRITTIGPDRAAQVARQLRVSLEYFTLEPAPDRGVVGIDLVDFLDGYECVNDMADRETIRAYLVTERGFPYDFAGSSVCP